MATSRHSWETPSHSWDNPAGDNAALDDEGWGYDSSDWEEPPTPPGEEFVQLMLSYLNDRTLNAKQFCQLMYMAGKAGVKDATKYGLAPGAPSGHYQRKLDTVMESRQNTQSFYNIQVPGSSKHELSRTVATTSAIVPHEALVEESTTPGFYTALNEWASSPLPPAYLEHPVVGRKAAEGVPGGPVLGLSLYLDGVPYSNTDSVLGFWIQNLATRRRHLCCILRKRCSCQCGCRGWCSFFAILQFLRWSLDALAVGFWPESRHDKKEWKPEDTNRKYKGGDPLPFRACVVYIKGDWAEYATSLGFPSWQDSVRPCFGCCASGEDMYTPHGNSPMALRWACNGDHDYESACARCEIIVDLDEETKKAVLSKLRYDKRSNGSRGRCLTGSVPALGLMAGDRLEPCTALPDVGGLEALAVPATVTFWRCSEDTLARHRNPLFGGSAGINPVLNLTIDVLHCLNLGVMKVWCAYTIRELLSSDVFATIGASEERNRAALQVLRHELMAWYKRQRYENPHEKLTELHDLTMKMVGTRDSPQCKTKGAETYGITRFLVEFLQRHSARLGENGMLFQRAGQALVQMVGVWKQSGTILAPTALKQLFDLYGEHMRLMEKLGHFIKKHHLLWHLIYNIPRHGNPILYATWEDEALNKHLKLCCRHTSQATFVQSVLLRMREQLQAKRPRK